ncbi:hypothetical protein [Leucobacter luti]|uniref:hypothetical protein n=1 Tax=Leucobacter luti TaxID=340320 RepID=UPI003CFF1A2E
MSNTPAKHPWLKILGVMIGLGAAVSLMLLAFLAPAINSGPKDLPLAVSGPAPVVEKIGATLDAKQPSAFDVTVHDDEQSAADAVHDREAIGAISVGADGAVDITVAGGAGAPYVPLMQGIGRGLEAQGMKVTTNDVARSPRTTRMGPASPPSACRSRSAA